MMKFFNLLKYILMITFLFAVTANAQDRQAQREREHQAVKNLLRQMEQNQEVKQHSPEVMEQLLEKESGTKIGKENAQRDRKSFIMNGNRVTMQVYNYGGIGPGYGLLRHTSNGVWNGLSYVFQFCPFVAAAVPEDSSGEVVHIISDALNDYGGLFEVNPADPTELWQWQPLAGYADSTQGKIASNPAEDADGDGKPDSWPRNWYNETLGKYVWPGFLSQDASNADLEIYWAMDDRFNREFDYKPFPVADTSRRGLGVQVDGRAFQWSNSLAENTIFFVYTITNTSERDLDSVIFGIYGDPDVGGGSPENTDDWGYFVPPYSTPNVNVDNIPVYSRSMVYFYDVDREGDYGLPLGYIGCKFLESPGSVDGQDNDGDGMIDETQYDGIDNDGDWNPDLHDVGIDGIPQTGDEGEGDGFPTAGKVNPDGSPDPLAPGEPNFEFTDLDESDQIGLTSFNSWTWRDGGSIADDERMWNRSLPGNFSDIQNKTDIVFIFGSGFISLKAGETKRISMALLYGYDLDDLLLSAETVQTIYNQNYQFFKPPVLPTVTAVPGDKKVTLYWDDAAEQSIDPITGKDFEGYVIYRSTDPDFEDIKLITDGRGSAFLNDPLKTVDGTEAKWDIGTRTEPFEDLNQNGQWDKGEPYTDLDGSRDYTAEFEDWWDGFHPVEYQGRGVHYYLGNNSGLVHSFVDSNEVINGQTYYYAVVAYDHGDSIGIPPTETTKKISVDPITGELKFDKNTVSATPGKNAGGYVAPPVTGDNVMLVSGRSTAAIELEIMDPLDVPEGASYEITFKDSIVSNGQLVKGTNFTLLSKTPVTDAVTFYETKYSQLSYGSISNDSYLEVVGPNGTTYTQGTDYMLDFERGTIRRVDGSSIPDNSRCNVTYRYFPVRNSTALNGEDTNPVFDGLRVKLYDFDDVSIDTIGTGWKEGNTNFRGVAQLTQLGLKNKVKYPADYEVVFSENIIGTSKNTSGQEIDVTFQVFDVTPEVGREEAVTVLVENAVTRNDSLDWGESILIFLPGQTGASSDSVGWQVGFYPPSDSNAVPREPTDGDVYLIKTNKPFTSRDVFQFTTESAKMSTELAKSALDDIYVVPNPYVGYNELEPANPLPGQTRGERRIYFENLPPQCTIRIYTLSGELVNTLQHDSAINSGSENWNLLNRDGFAVAYGVYVAHIDAPGIGEKILKFALIK
ncbi:MAG: hypothetical protein SCALA702_16400 [Melioribacteraceae bacterium]|nr:MAG: hypothetical protein SCALA702_16400 [Melioribacteraceae bacterium]